MRTSWRKVLERRRAVNRQLAIQDAKNRCVICKRAIVKRFERFGDPRGFCSEACRDEAQ